MRDEKDRRLPVFFHPSSLIPHPSSLIPSSCGFHRRRQSLAGEQFGEQFSAFPVGDQHGGAATVMSLPHFVGRFGAAQAR